MLEKLPNNCALPSNSPLYTDISRGNERREAEEKLGDFLGLAGLESPQEWACGV